MLADKNIQSADFIRDIVSANIESDSNMQIVTRFPPEPNGYLHIGHAKSICLNFGIAAENNGICHLRFDDTNPIKEGQEYVDAIKRDISWLGWDWGEHLYFASDYFDQLYDYAIQLIKNGCAYVDDLSPEQIRTDRGTLTEPGIDSPYRNRTVEENLDLIGRMKSGEFEEGSRVLRAKIDMTSGNLNMRDPVMYRILNAPHQNTGNKWCLYPMYDFAHGQSDSIEKITHSICTMEFEDHRPLYDWFIDALGIHHPQQIEFARLNLSYTVLSKRKLLQLVNENHVTGWDDPRMPTLSGLRRRGYTPEAIRNFCERIGVAKRQNTVDIALLEHCVREDLNIKAERVMAVLNPLKLIIDNYPDDKLEELDALNNPEDPSMGTHKLPFTKELFVESDDYKEQPPEKFYRLTLGQEVRLRYGYIITCVAVDKDPNTGEVTALHCTYDPETRGGKAPDGRRIRGTIHWVSAKNATDAEVRLYDNLFTVEKPDEIYDYTSALNPNSAYTVKTCKIESRISTAAPETRYQFERIGYFCVDNKDSSPNALVFNRIVGLRDTWSKIERKSNT